MLLPMAREPADTTQSATSGQGGSAPPGARPYLFLALQSHRPLAPPARFALSDVDEVVIGRGREPRISLSIEGGARRLLVQLEDPWLSGNHARVRRLLGRHFLEDLGSKNGSLVGGVHRQRQELRDQDVIELGHAFFTFREAIASIDPPPLVFHPAPTPPALSTLSPLWSDALLDLARVARSEIAVLLQGETGTGKEVLAREVHRASRRGGDFVAVNCGALPRELVESELFGHRRGAFSGAVEDRTGLVRGADRGTLLLDEIGDMPLAAQTALLRVLQEREVRPVGAPRPVPIDVRFLAATHRDLDALARAGQFRADLLARLSGHIVTLPPLRERKHDIGLLLADVLASGGTLTPPAARALFAYDWPGNIRELRKSLTTAVVLAEGAPIDLRHLPAVVSRPAPPSASGGEIATRQRLSALLAEHRGNLSAVARATGKARVQIQRWVKRFELDPEDFRGHDP